MEQAQIANFRSISAPQSGFYVQHNAPSSYVDCGRKFYRKLAHGSRGAVRVELTEGAAAHLEDGRSGIAEAELKKLLDLFEFPETEREVIFSLGIESRKLPRSKTYSDLLPDAFRRFAELEVRSKFGAMRRESFLAYCRRRITSVLPLMKATGFYGTRRDQKKSTALLSRLIGKLRHWLLHRSSWCTLW